MMGKVVWPIQIAILLLLCFCVQGEYLKYKDPKQPLSVRIRDLLGRMTLEEKIGQMTMVERKLVTPDIIRRYFIGNLLSEGDSKFAPKARAETWINMVNEFQRLAISSRLGIPMLYGIDALHGQNTVYNATIFPHNVGLGVTRDPELVKKIGAATALEARATGITYTFAPSVAVCRDPRWGRCYESYSEDHKIVEAMTEIIPGLQGELPENYPSRFPYVRRRTNIAACAKHFVGDGATSEGIDEKGAFMDWSELLRVHMPAYNDSINKGVATIMVSFTSLNGVKMHVRRDLITGYLKTKLNFKGIVISDAGGIDKITNPPKTDYANSIKAGINAGIDLAMTIMPFLDFIGNITVLVKNNDISMDRINDAVERILRVKFIMGLFENPITDLTLVNQIGSQEHRELAREAVRRSLVLLKNGKNGDAPLLPLPKKAVRILLAGSHANDLGYQCGGWTITWQGGSGNTTVGTTILSAVKNAVHPQTEVIHEKNPGAKFLSSNTFSYAIVVVGELPYAERFGDSKNLTIAEPGYDTIVNVCRAMKCVVVLITGRPVVIEPYVELMDGLVVAWLPGTEGQGIADVLFGDYGFTGKLARTWFRSVDQLPMNVGDPHYDPLFPFGFGLTTTGREMRDSQ